MIRLDISSPNPDDEEGTYTRTVNLLFDPVTQAERNEGYWVRVSSLMPPFACLVMTPAGGSLSDRQNSSRRPTGVLSYIWIFSIGV